MGGRVDDSVFHALNQGPDWLEPSMRFFSQATDYGWFKVLILLMVGVLIYANPKTRLTAIQALLAFPIADGLTNLIKKTFPYLRPCNALDHWVFHGIGCSESFGTASAHSANMAAIAVVFAYHLRWWGSVWIVVAFLTGISRVYTGMHYPSQVLLGWMVGVCVSFLVIKTWEWIVQSRQAVRSDGIPK